jgi:hypothetical protein
VHQVGYLTGNKFLIYNFEENDNPCVDDRKVLDKSKSQKWGRKRAK